MTQPTKTIRIDLNLIARKAKYCRNHQDQYDLSGMLALALSSELLSRGDKLLSNLSRPIYPLTTEVRSKIVLTPTGYAILQLSNRSPSEQISAANQLLAPYGITLLPEKGCGLPSNKLTNLTQPEPPELSHNFVPCDDEPEPNNFRPNSTDLDSNGNIAF